MYLWKSREALLPFLPDTDRLYLASFSKSGSTTPALLTKGNGKKRDPPKIFFKQQVRRYYMDQPSLAILREATEAILMVAVAEVALDKHIVNVIFLKGYCPI